MEQAGNLFGPGQLVLIAALVLLAAVLLVSRTDVVTVPAVAVTGLVAAELAGVGLVSIRRWGLFVGGGYSRGSTVGWQEGRVLAAAMGVACAAVAMACLVLVLRAGWSWHPIRGAVVLPAALVVAIGAPLFVETARGDRSDTVAWAVMYSLPLAAALALAALVPRPVGFSLVLAVAASTLVAPWGESFLEVMAPSGRSQPLVLVAAGAVAAVLTATSARDRDGQRDPTGAPPRVGP